MSDVKQPEAPKPVSGKFVIKQITAFADLATSKVLELAESDLCFQDKENIYQFGYVKPEEDEKYEIKPGIFLLSESSSGIFLSKMELRERNLLETAKNTEVIMKEARTFFSKLHIYEKRKRPKKRGVLLYSNPGMGKSSAIEKFCQNATQEDPGTVVMIWPTSEIAADDISRFLSTSSLFLPECTRMILILEDIGGGDREGHHGDTPVDSGLLNLLDGVGLVFKLPTFIIATTNKPENLLSSLCDRPGRFDLMLELAPPSHQEKILLMEFITQRTLSDEEKECLGKKGTENFSIAHLEEIDVRSELHDKTHMQVVDELISHSANVKRDFTKGGNSMGIGSR